MFILSSISSGLEFWSVNHTSIYKNYELNVFTSKNALGGISNNWPNKLLGTNVYKTDSIHVYFNHIDNRCAQYYTGLILLFTF